MNTYELMLIINPQLTDAEVGEAVEKAKKLIVDSKGEVLAEDRIGRKKFSHAVGKNRDGFYVYLKVKVLPASVKEINHQLKLQDGVLRAMLMKASAEPAKKP